MIAQQEMQNLLILPLPEGLRIAQRLIESAVSETTDQLSEATESINIAIADAWTSGAS